MSVAGNEPVSAANLGAALGVSVSGDIGLKPICVDNLKAAIRSQQLTILYDGPRSEEPVSLARSVYEFDYIIIEREIKHAQSDITALIAMVPDAVVHGAQQVQMANIATVSGRINVPINTINHTGSNDEMAVYASNARPVTRVFGIKY